VRGAHIVNSLALPLSLWKSYSLFSGVQDALVQWWYGHNAVAFFLTTPILGIMYYFLPKAAERPVYSYRLSIIHFWSLVFMYIWAGPHHLLYTALPDWAQSLGMVFSLMLWAPSWGGMLNGLLTMRGAWHKLRERPGAQVLRRRGHLLRHGDVRRSVALDQERLVAGALHGLDHRPRPRRRAGLERPHGRRHVLLADPAHLPARAPFEKAAEIHFWLATVGIVVYMIAMWVSGVTQGLMWRATNPDGTLLYPGFVETLLAIRPMYIVRMIGGSMYLVGFGMMAWNLWMTVRGAKATNAVVDVVVEDAPPRDPVGVGTILAGRPLWFSILGFAAATLFVFVPTVPAIVLAVLVFVIAEVAYVIAKRERAAGKESWFALIERRPLAFTVLVLFAILVGGVAELLPTIWSSRRCRRPERRRSPTRRSSCKGGTFTSEKAATSATRR
jgi:cytochrome c oxidase cbb3-type subunit I/II